MRAMGLKVKIYDTPRVKEQIVNVIEYGYTERNREFIRCKERRGRLILGVHCEWAGNPTNSKPANCAMFDVMRVDIYTCLNLR